jgi:hypothetical protein
MADMHESSPVFSRKGANSAEFFMCFYLHEIAVFFIAALAPLRE